MPANIIEIATDHKKLSVYRGFLRIESSGNVQRDIPFHLIYAVIISAYDVVLTYNLLQRLCDENIPLVILGKNYVPNGLLLSYVGQSRQTEVQYAQISYKKPLEKRIWQALIKEKIKNQARVLDLFHKKNVLTGLTETVLSGDTTNREGYAARIYFKALFGPDFIRDTDQTGLNSFLNYGYTILRSALARYVVAAGLNPSYGVGHQNKLNPFCLVDDLIEPFRPVVDAAVYPLFYASPKPPTDLTPAHKAALAGLLTREYPTETGTSPLYMILQQLVWDLVAVFKSKEINFHFNKNLLCTQNDEKIS